MAKIPFDEKQLELVRQDPSPWGPMFPPTPIYNWPVTRKEAFVSMVRDKQPIWTNGGAEGKLFCPSVIPDNIARGFVIEGAPWPEKYTTGKDMFGIEWVYVEQVGGATVKPGNPFMDDVSEWREKIVWPNIEEWDWEGSKKLNEAYLAGDQPVTLWFLNGCWFERLISFLDFEGAAMALLDEDVEDDLHELLHKTTSLYIDIAKKCVETYNIDGFCIHDDWGSQMAPFFSDAKAREFFLPEMKRFCDAVHAMGKFVELHSCGHNEDRCGIFVEAGFDSWTPMGMNNTAELYEKYGDKIVLGCIDHEITYSADPTEEEVRAAARQWVSKYCKPGKAGSTYSMYSAPICADPMKNGMLTAIFNEELYFASRKAYGEM